jgi:adenylate cyclase
VRFRFSSFRSRILTFVLGLLVLVQGAVLIAVNVANEREARQHINEALELTAGAFRRSLGSREQILLEKARLLSGDFAFKEVAATGDHVTLLSALENHQARVGGNVMMLLGMDGQVMADTLHPEATGKRSALMPLVAAVMESEFGEASAIQPIDGVPYQLVVVPLFAPEPSAWIVIGFALHDEFAQALQRETNSHVSLVWRAAGGWSTFCSTLREALRVDLEAALTERRAGAVQATVPMSLAGDEYVSAVAPVSNIGMEVVAVLQRSLDEALQPFMRLRTLLFLIFAAGLALSIFGGFLLAARVTRPVARLAHGAGRIEAGNYVDPVDVDQEDELGSLAISFNNMMRGLAERDRVRDMLGKVVSPEIAEELLSKKIELGGEEREVSVLFTDVRDFTSVAERESPQGLVKLLNTYLTWLTGIVERHGGVVEQYVGDAVMALFGAPVGHEDDALRSVRAAMELCSALPEINAELGRLGGSSLAMGVGIHTDIVVAGNIGSPSRLNYKVVGDGVNLASRLEGLTKRYHVGAIVSESTRGACPGIAFRELDTVRVKGRSSAVAIYEPIGVDGKLEASVVERLTLHREGLACYRARDWVGADAIFNELAHHMPDAALYRLYLDRTAMLRLEPPDENWDGIVAYREK